MSKTRKERRLSLFGSKTPARQGLVYPHHPLAEMFPLMEGEEFTAFVDDIKAHGVRELITLFDGQILDGRNRDQAAAGAGIELTEENFTELPADADPRAFVISANIHRRHLTTEKRKDLAEQLLKAEPSQSNRTIAATVNLDPKTVGVVRSDAEAREEIPHVETRTDAAGREQPSNKSNGKHSVRLTSQQVYAAILKRVPKVKGEGHQQALLENILNNWGIDVITKALKAKGFEDPRRGRSC